MLLICQNATMRVNGAWIKRYCALCSKTYNTLHSCHNFPGGSRQAARGARICETGLFYPVRDCDWLILWAHLIVLFVKCTALTAGNSPI